MSTPTKPSIVFCHGIWADGSCWNKLIPPLQAEGYEVIAAQYGLDTNEADVAATRATLGRVHNPAILVGHSYGGAVITNAATGNRNVKALVYVDAAAPAPGETNGQLSGSDSILTKDTPAQLFTTTAIPGAPAADSELYLNEDIFVHNFANDLPRSES